MLHPSYTDLMQIVNREVGEGDSPVVSSRYSIVLATSKRARQIIDGCVPKVECGKDAKPLSIAVAEINKAEVKILSGNEINSEEEENAESIQDAEDAAEESQTEESAKTADVQDVESQKSEDLTEEGIASEGETEEK